MKGSAAHHHTPTPLAACILATALLAHPFIATGQTSKTEAGSLRVESSMATDGSRIAAMTIDADVPKTEVYLDGEFRGHTPLVLRDVTPGMRQLTLKKDGFRGTRSVLELKPGETKKVYAELARAAGRLTVTGVPKGTSLEIDGRPVMGTSVALAEGPHSLAVRAFGFLEKRQEITIERDADLSVPVTLEPAPFSATDAKAVKKAFNPDGPAPIASTGVSFTVSGPGTATLRVLDASGTVVRKIAGGPFAESNQRIAWDGRGEDGKALPDGDYALEVRAAGIGAESSAERTEPLRAAVRIDRTLSYPATSPWHGVGARGPVASGALMSPGTIVVSVDTGFSPSRVAPAVTAIAGVTDWLETSLRVGVSARGTDGASADMAGGAKVGLPEGLAGGLLKPAIHARYETDVGLAAGLSISLVKGRYSAGASGELAYGDEDGLFADPFVSWNSGISLASSLGGLSLAAWLESSGARDGEAFSAKPEWGSGIGAQWAIPATKLLLSGDCGWKSGDGDGRVEGRAGFGFML